MRVTVCGVCRTDLHLAEGDLPSTRRCPATRSSASSTSSGREPRGSRSGSASDRVATPHLRARAASVGRGAENLCLERPVHGLGRRRRLRRATPSWTRTSPTPLPDAFSTTDAAPLLCAGIIGYRALRRGGRHARAAGWASSASAHPRTSPAQVAMAEGVDVPRGTHGRPTPGDSPSSSAATWVGDTFERPPDPLDAAIVFAPAGEIVLIALGRARPGRHGRGRRHPPQRHPAAAATPTTCSRSAS